MTRTASPLAPRFVGTWELAELLAILVIVDPESYTRPLVLQDTLLVEHAAYVDMTRICLLLDGLGAFQHERRAGYGGSARKMRVRCLADLTAHERMRIARARREDEAVAALPRPAPILALPAESLSAAIDRLLG